MEEEISLPYRPTLKSAFLQMQAVKEKPLCCPWQTKNPKSELLGTANKMVQNVYINIWLIAIITALWICFVETRFNHTESLMRNIQL